MKGGYRGGDKLLSITVRFCCRLLFRTWIMDLRSESHLGLLRYRTTEALRILALLSEKMAFNPFLAHINCEKLGEITPKSDKLRQNKTEKIYNKIQ